MNGWEFGPEGYVKTPTGRYLELGETVEAIIFDDVFPPIRPEWADLKLSELTVDTLREHPDLFALEGALFPIWELFP